MKSQKKRILEHLQKYGQITPIVALQHYGCFRLAARVAELKADGFIIETKLQQTIHSGRYAKYVYNGFVD